MECSIGAVGWLILNIEFEWCGMGRSFFRKKSEILLNENAISVVEVVARQIGGDWR